MTLLGWAATFFIVALIAAAFGFGGIVEGATGIAVFLFWLFVVLFAISLIVGLVGGHRGHGPSAHV